MELGFTIFAIAWAVCMASAVLSVAQWFAAVQFYPWAYRYGLVVLSEQRAIPRPGKPHRAGETLETANGKFRFLGPDECLFRVKMRWFYNKQPVLPGIIHWSGDQAQICCRLPIPITAFYSAWMFGVAVGMLVAVLQSERRGPIGLALAAALFVIVGVSAGCLGFACDRSRELVRELEAVLGAAGEPPAISPPATTSTNE